MTEIAFHFNAPHKLTYACRLLRKIHKKGLCAVVTAPFELLQQLDTALWLFSPVEFIPHCLHGSEPQIEKFSSVFLTEHIQSLPHSQVLVNLGEKLPENFHQFEQLIEVVSRDDAADKVLARSRWKHYAANGYAITRHDLLLKN